MIKINLRPLLTLLFLILLPRFATSQDLENITKQKPVDLSGSLSLRLNTFSTSSPNSTRDPFFWTLSGNPTLSLYGVTLPFSFVISDKQKDFRQPFNQFGVSPYYKKIRFHAGYRSVYFSDYTLSDHLFLGGGIEAEPSIFRLGFVYGRFMKAVEAVTDTIAGEYTAPSFARKGFAAKFGLGTYTNYVDFIVLKIRDDSTSVKSELEDTGIAAAENLVLGVKSQQQIAKIFSFDIDVAMSAYTSDLRSEKLTDEKYKIPSFIKGIFTPRMSSSFLFAGKASFGVRLKKLALKLNYRRVEPDYQSMGAYYINTDIENLTIAPSWSMFKSTLRVNGSIGFQRNNLFKDKVNNSVRRANSASVSYVPNAKWGFNVNYSNYNMSQTRNYALVRDTLILEQFSNNINGNLFFNFGPKNRKQNLSFANAYMNLSDNNNDSLSNKTTSLNPSISYRFTNSESKFSFHINWNASIFNTYINETFRWGLSSGVNKTLAKDKLKLGGNLSYFTTRLNSQNYSNTWSIGSTIGYQPHKNHSLNLSLNLVNRSFAATEQQGSSDFIGNFGYTYNF
jgi:hypothetical protein